MRKLILSFRVAAGTERKRWYGNHQKQEYNRNVFHLLVFLMSHTVCINGVGGGIALMNILYFISGWLYLFHSNCTSATLL
jgi:hypothetical protein